MVARRHRNVTLREALVRGLRMSVTRRDITVSKQDAQNLRSIPKSELSFQNLWNLMTGLISLKGGKVAVNHIYTFAVPCYIKGKVTPLKARCGPEGG